MANQSSDEKPSLMSRLKLLNANLDEFSFKLGRRLLSPFLPGLKDLSEEQIAGEPEYRAYVRLAGMSALYVVAGAVFLVFERYVVEQDLSSLTSLVYLRWIGFASVGFGSLALVMSFIGLRVVMQVRSRAASEADLQWSRDPTFRNVERIRSERASLEERLFQRNLSDDFDLKAFDWRGVSLFEDGGYRFAPRVNVLLGKRIRQDVAVSQPHGHAAKGRRL